MCGLISRDTFSDAVTLEELSLRDGEWREWPLFASDGDTAALISLASDTKVSTRFAIPCSRLMRYVFS